MFQKLWSLWEDKHRVDSTVLESCIDLDPSLYLSILFVRDSLDIDRLSPTNDFLSFQSWMGIPSELLIVMKSEPADLKNIPYSSNPKFWTCTHNKQLVPKCLNHSCSPRSMSKLNYLLLEKKLEKIHFLILITSLWWRRSRLLVKNTKCGDRIEQAISEK